MSKSVKIAITYCAECGYESQTVDLAKDLMVEFQHQLSSVELIPWYEGSFEVSVGGEVVHSMYRDGGFAEHSVVKDAVRRKLAEAGAE
jgi:selenoprotein W-related protein